MIKIYALLYVVTGMLLVRDELILIEDASKATKELTMKIAYLVDWICLILLFPLVKAVKYYAKTGNVKKATKYRNIYQTLKDIIVFIPKNILITIRMF